MGSKAFSQRCIDMAKDIRSGGLYSDENVSQVKKKSFEPLAQINDLGYLTIDSQDGQKDERAYVAGFMEASQAHAFAEALNCGSDKLAVVLQPCPKEIRSKIAVTRHLGKGVTNAPLYIDNKEYNFLKTDYAGLRKDADVLLLECIDTQWERKAYSKQGGLFDDMLHALFQKKRAKTPAAPQ